MIKSIRLLMLLLAVAAGLGAFNVTTYAVSSTALVTICFRNKTIQIPYYLRFRYYSFGAYDGPCFVSTP